MGGDCDGGSDGGGIWLGRFYVFMIVYLYIFIGNG